MRPPLDRCARLRLGAGPGRWRWLCPDSNGPALGLLQVERPGHADQIAEFPKAVSARVEVGGDGGKALSNSTQTHPTILRLHLRNDLVQDRDSRTGWLESIAGEPFSGCCKLRLG